MTDANSKIDVRRLKVGNLLFKILVGLHCTLGLLWSSIPFSRSVMIIVPVNRRHLERLDTMCPTRRRARVGKGVGHLAHV